MLPAHLCKDTTWETQSIVPRSAAQNAALLVENRYEAKVMRLFTLFLMISYFGVAALAAGV